MRRRLLKILLVTLGVVAFTGYFAFSTFFFSPTEGDYEADVSTLIPRDVDFYLAKAGLAEDLDPFPVPAFVGPLEASTGGRVLFQSPEWQAFRAEQGLQEVMAEIQGALAALPLDLAPLDVLGGRDVAVAGYARSDQVVQWDWAVYARGNWMAKLGLALLMRPGLLDLSGRGLQVVADDDRVSISGDMPRTLHVTRVRDVFVVSTDPAMLQEAVDLAAVTGEDSFGGSARYYDHIQQRVDEGDEVELFVDYRSISETMRFAGRWPDPEAPDLFPAFCARLFQSGALKELAGVMRFDGGLTLEAHGALSSELVSSFQKQLYRQRGFDRDRIFEVARYAPADSALFAYFHAPFGATLRQLLDSSEFALRENLDDLVRTVWRYPDTSPLIDDLDAAFHDRAALVVRANDYPVDAEGPPHDGSPVFAWAVILWTDAGEKIDEVRRAVIDNQRVFGIAGREGEAAGVYTNEASGGQLIYEFWSPLVPGTGHIATVTDNGQRVFILSNQHKMLGQLLKTWFEGGAAYPRLADAPRFGALVSAGMPGANVVVYTNPDAAAGTLRQMSDRWAELEMLSIPWDELRAQLAPPLIRERFPEWGSYDTLSDEQKDELEPYLKPRLDEHAATVQEQQLPALRARYERRILYAEEVDAALLELVLDAKEIDVWFRAITGLEPEG